MESPTTKKDKLFPGMPSLSKKQKILSLMLSKLSGIILGPPTNKVTSQSNLGITRDSLLADHGLDSLDHIEIVMQIEEDLGYEISAETIPAFHTVKNYINYIEQVEAFKR